MPNNIKYLIEDDITTSISTANNGLKITDKTLQHTNSITANTNSAIYGLKYNKQGHITGTAATNICPSANFSCSMTSGFSLSNVICRKINTNNLYFLSFNVYASVAIQDETYNILQYPYIGGKQVGWGTCLSCATSNGVGATLCFFIVDGGYGLLMPIKTFAIPAGNTIYCNGIIRTV